MKTIMEKSAACCVVLAVLSTTVLYGAAKMDPPASQADAAKAQLLFVQTAQGLACTNNTIVLKGVNPITIYFSDRPERIAGHLTTAEFVPTWGEGPNIHRNQEPLLKQRFA